MVFSSSMFWPNYNYTQQNSSSNYDGVDENYDYNYMMYSSSSSSSSSSTSVDCTLSLGTPSTRLTNTHENTKQTSHHRNSVSSFCWDLLHPSSYHHSSTPATKPHRAAATTTADPLLARRCANCDTTSTPLWRNGPRGPKSLCNACGIRFKKEERRAAAATTTTAAHTGSTAGMVDSSTAHHNGYYNGPWANQYNQGTHTQKMQCYGGHNEFRFVEDGTDSAGTQFLSWLTHDRPSGLVHDFTR
ncbi:hypothetical protein Cgig2_009571 [Carnegiea gigantea]|uniref:GATA-type domain-containing protein n=1 Tax=Carnegiea gigantea TaxID=171969 RepID=A0A9Q1KAM3_9CARY|nr:hypothetical protein Cgig2_009571 [Carnegiea gigantea]